MATVGLSKPYGAVYSVSGGVVSYDTPVLLGKAVQLDLTLDSATDNTLYADNAPAETDNQFAGGSIELTTDNLSAEVIGAMLGITGEAIGTTTDKWYKFDNSQVTPYMGFGAIRKVIKDGAIKWQAIVYPKVQFQNMSESIVTQGETIDWQTPSITATLMRDDTTNNEWKRISSYVETEARAEELVKLALGVTPTGGNTEI